MPAGAGADLFSVPAGAVLVGDGLATEMPAPAGTRPRPSRARFLHVTPAPSPLHQWVSKRLQRQLEEYFETREVAVEVEVPA